MATLTNTKIKDTYDGLLKTTNNEAIAASGTTLIEDGLGNASALSVGRVGNGVTVNGLLDVTGEVQGTSLDINGAADISGSLNATLATAAQPNITSVGTLSSLAVSGNLAVDTNTLYVDASSNEVGIGTSSPSYQLQVQNSTNAILALTAGTADNQYAQILFGDSANAAQGRIRYENFTDSMEFIANSTSAMLIDSSGNVGIGITPSGAKLDVLGNLRVRREAASTQYTEIESGGGESIIRGKNNASSLYQSLIFESGNNATTEERMRITSDGDVLFGTTGTPNGTSIYGSGFISGSGNRRYLNLATSETVIREHIQFFNPNGKVGTISTNGSSTAYNTSSDYRLKENVVEMTGALDRVDALKPSRFNFIADPDKTVDGFIAHEVQAIVPEAVTGEKDAVDEEGNPVYQGIDQSKIVPLLVGAIQELKAEIELLKSQING